MEPSSADELARLLFEATEGQGPRADSKEVIARFKRLEMGLPAEDEFALMLAWLGKCRLVHRLDQQQSPPESRSNYQVPDLLAIFDFEGKELPVLIEVKTSKKKRLSWKVQYWDKLKRYAGAVQLPILVACKWTEAGLWSLVDLDCFDASEATKKLQFADAVQNDLLGILAGNFYYTFQPRVGLHLKFEKISEAPSEEPDTRTYRMIVREAYFYNSKGEVRAKLANWLFPMFLDYDHETRTVDGDKFLDQDYFIPDPAAMQIAYKLLPQVVRGLAQGQKPHWRKLLRDCDFAISCPELQRSASKEFETGMLQYIMEYRPKQLPSFLTG